MPIVNTGITFYVLDLTEAQIQHPARWKGRRAEPLQLIFRSSLGILQPLQTYRCSWSLHTLRSI